MTRRSWIVLAALAIVGSVFGVIFALNQSNIVSQDIQGQWTLIEARDADGEIDVSATAIVLTADESTVRGSVCNTFSGPYSVRGSTLRIEELAATEMWCESPDGIMELESRFLAALPATHTVEFEGTNLVLTGDDIRLVFAQSTPD